MLLFQKNLFETFGTHSYIEIEKLHKQLKKRKISVSIIFILGGSQYNISNFLITLYYKCQIFIQHYF